MTALQQSGQTVPADQIDSLISVINLVRKGEALTRPELGMISDLGRRAVTHRVDLAIELGLMAEADLGVSTGGRHPRQLRFRAEAGVALVAIFGVLELRAAVTDLSGRILASDSIDWDIGSGPELSLARLRELFSDLLNSSGTPEVWGIGIGVPGPVEFLTARPIMPPLMPGWNNFDVRAAMQNTFNTPVWLDNEVNLLALGQLNVIGPSNAPDLLFIQVGTGVGTGIVSGGRVHRGANGAAGDIAHMEVSRDRNELCRCGQRGCLEAVVGGWALARDATVIASGGKSEFLANRLRTNGRLVPSDVAEGAAQRDATCLDLVSESGRITGDAMSGLVSFFNPSVVVVGGTIGGADDGFLASLRRSIYRRPISLATRDVRIVSAAADSNLGLKGAAAMVTGRLFNPQVMKRWVLNGDPTTHFDQLYLNYMTHDGLSRED